MALSDSIRNGKVDSDGVFSAECAKRDRTTWVQSSIDLNPYLRNTDGEVDWDGKRYVDSAKNLGVEDNTTLFGEFKDENGKWVGGSIRLGTRIQNDDGVLKYKKVCDPS